MHVGVMVSEHEAGTASDDKLLGLAFVFAWDFGVKKRGLPPKGFGNLGSAIIVNIKSLIRHTI